MAGHFGFSYIGLILLVLILAPNVVFTRFGPTDMITFEENRVLVILERVGQALCFALVLLFDDFNLRRGGLWLLWLGGAFLCVILYLICWGRYYAGNHEMRDLHRSFLGIPLPMAVLPTAAFLLLSVYGSVIWLLLAGVLFGIGHIWNTARNMIFLKKREGD